MEESKRLKQRVPNRRAFFEVLLILFVMFILTWSNKQLALIAAIIPIVYFFVEHNIRGGDNARIKGLWSDIRQNWHWFGLVVVLQVLYTVTFKTFLPEVFDHLHARVPLIQNGLNFNVVVALLFAAYGEEIAFRGLFQERFAWYMRPAAAIVVTSLLFALIHLSEGGPLVVGADLTTVFLDSVVFGIIYYRTRNIFAGWIAHFAANVVALIAIGLV
ncbi:CPBP family intramembrane glutamic endopeptidase [Paenibacillus thermotolerans]|uniref:CPBP family intramembrane glutamic endopeptidase n=1 Tax=Paenibacillus thermotolerans TaxID=3027807 RepID=UPI00236894E5|nr:MULTISPECIES: type II CAAX endopeptidase family protein [unclassified Paenibacillus]